MKSNTDESQSCKVIRYLDKSNLRNPKNVKTCLELKSTQPDHDIFSLFEIFEDANFYIAEQHLNALLLMSQHNMQRLAKLFFDLMAARLLTQTSFEHALQRVTLTLPPVTESTVAKKRRKESGWPRSEFTVDGKNHFFVEPSKTRAYKGGCGGEIKRGFNTASDDDPVYAIKKLNEEDVLASRQEAIREVTFHRLLGRQAFYFSKNKTTRIVSEWQCEKALYDFTADEVMHEPFVKRLTCLVAGLIELNVFHANYRVHGDVKCQNAIVDFKQASMKLIDFGESRKVGSLKLFGRTLNTSDPRLMGMCAYHFCDDMYAMGIVTAHLFPEIYAVSFSKAHARLSVVKADLTMAERAIVCLVSAMMNVDRKKRCTSEDAVKFCQGVITHNGQLDDALLEGIMAGTIKRVAMTEEDVFRGVFRVR